MHDTEAMVKAHRAGMKAFHDGNVSASMARTLAHKHYTSRDEREAFIAGYLGAMRRATQPQKGV